VCDILVVTAECKRPLFRWLKRGYSYSRS